ncbi:MAG: DUF2007 domain-containing protein [Chloroflexi bacterium]|nr:DUF2007 domain-containing protein [Chloroflexota bacterium]
MSQKLVTIATFRFPQEAYIFKAKLESRDIQSFIEDEYIITMMWLYSTAVGGVKLKVRESDEAEALKIIGQERSVPEAKRKRVGLSYYLFAVLSLAERGWTLIIPAFLVTAMLVRLVEWYKSRRHSDKTFN